MRINCKVYAREMQLLGLRRQLANPHLDNKKKEALLKEITKLEQALGLREDDASED